jgi:guanylate kinase
MAQPQRGRLIVISGPSGVGKTTIVKELLEESPLPLVLSVSATTRAPRAGEQHGIDYYFLTPEEFARKRAAGEFLECCEVFGRGRWYGTLRSEVASSLNLGKWVILEIDVQGARKVVAQYPDAITIFVHPESMEELENRLRGRQTESEDRVQERLESARREMEHVNEYRYPVINRTVTQAVQEISQILGREGGI